MSIYRHLRVFLGVLIFFSGVVHADSYLSLEGHLGEEELEESLESLSKVVSADTDRMIIRVSSVSGDLRQVLVLAKRIYQLKRERELAVTVYIEDNAVGPAAIIPFLADELLVSHFVSWGDIPLDSDISIPTNILRSRVESLVSRDHPQRALLMLMVQAMVDPEVIVVNDGGWRRGAEEEVANVQVVSPKTETLVVNQNQIRELRLAAEVLSAEEFKERYQTLDIKEEKGPSDGDDELFEALSGQLEVRLKEHIQFDKLGPNSIGRIVIDDRTSGITQATWIYVRAALEHYQKEKPAFIILELNTPGGEVFSSQKISDALKEMDTQYGVPVVAFVNNWAISAGAMLAYSCRFIGIVKDASMGAAEPVFAADGKMKSAPEKVNSALRADFGNRASFFDRDPKIAEAMVDKDIILVRRHGRILKLNSEEQIRKSGIEPDEIITTEGKLLTLNAEQQIEYGVADFMVLPTRLTPISDAEESAGSWPAEKSLLFSHPFFKQIPDSTIITYQMDWKTRFFSILAHPAVASLLFLGMLLGFYVEINSPGFGFPGSLALICMFLIVLSSFSLQAVGWLEFIFLIAGLLMILIDIMVIPTFGILGISGAILCLMGLFGLMLPGIREVSFDLDSQTLNAAGEFVLLRFVWLCGALLAAIVLIVLLAKYVMPTFTAYSRLILKGDEQEAAEGFVAGPTEKELPKIGTSGIVEATLRPAGKVVIDDSLYDAVSIGNFIEKGSSIVVVRVEAGKLIVDVKE